MSNVVETMREFEGALRDSEEANKTLQDKYQRMFSAIRYERSEVQKLRCVIADAVKEVDVVAEPTPLGVLDEGPGR